METPLIIAIISAGVAIFSAFFSAWAAAKARRQTAAFQVALREEERRHARGQIADKYREPLVTAAYDLQGRCFNIAEQGLIAVYLDNGTPEQRRYVVNSTAYVFAEYLCWTEIIRREVQVIDFEEEDRTRKLTGLLMSIRQVLLNDRTRGPFWIFSADQRGIGERMIGQDGRPIGYSTFCDLVDGDDGDRVLKRLCHDALRLGDELGAAMPRLVAMQHLLIDLIDFLDPAHVRYPAHLRKKIGG
jgi:hypothetical protein